LSLYPFTPLSLYPFIPPSLCPFIPLSLHPFAPLPLYSLIPSSLHPFIRCARTANRAHKPARAGEITSSFRRSHQAFQWPL
jgi:hypothetical protein